MTPRDPISLAHWRRRVAEMYAGVRAANDAEWAWQTFRESRDTLFRGHPQSPLSPGQRDRFDGLSYFQYDPAFRVMGIIEQDVVGAEITIALPDDGPVRLESVAQVRFELPSVSARLNLFWIRGYGGGIFLPFRDTTARNTTYAGGRYLYDTIKGADLCAYNESWPCPLAPPENDLLVAIPAGEKNLVT